MNKIKKTIGYGLSMCLPLVLVAVASAASTVQGSLNTSSYGGTGGYQTSGYNNGYNNSNSLNYGNGWNNNNWNHNGWNGWDNDNNNNSNNISNDVYNYISGRLGNMTNQQKIVQLQTVINLLTQKINMLQASGNGYGGWWNNR